MMQSGQRTARASAIGLGHGAPVPRSAALASTASRLAAGRVTARRDPELDDRARMIRVMMEAVDKMMGRLGIAVLAPSV